MNTDFTADSSSEKVFYPHSHFPVNTWKAYSRDFTGLSEVNHWHNDFEFIYITSGKMFFSVNGEEIQLDENTLLFVNSGNMHYGFQKEKTTCSMLCMQCSPELVADDTVGKYLHILCGRNSPACLIMKYTSFADRNFIDTYERLCSTVSESRNGFEFSALSMLFSLFADIYSRIVNLESPAAADKTVEIMHLMTGFIQREYASKITLADIAAAGLCCHSKCCMIFRNFLGKTPIEYLTEYRLSKGLELLRTTDLSITEIAGKCGFCGSSYFTEVFVKYFGFTPSDARKKERGVYST